MTDEGHRKKVRLAGESAVVFGIIALVMFAIPTAVSHSRYEALVPLGQFLVLASMATALVFVVCGVGLLRGHTWAIRGLLRASILAILLTLTSIAPLWGCTLHIVDLEESGVIPGEHLMGWVNGLAFVIGIGIDIVQVVYCLILLRYLKEMDITTQTNEIGDTG